MFLQHNINGVMYRKEEASDSLNNKLETQSRTEFVSNCEYTVLVLSIILSCVTEVLVRHGRGGGGFGNSGVFFGP